MRISIYATYRIHIINNYTYTNEDGDMVDGNENTTQMIDGGKLIEILGKDLLSFEFSEMAIKENTIYISKFDPTSGETQDYSIEVLSEIYKER